MVALKGHVRAKVALGCRWIHGCIAFIKPKVDWNSSTFYIHICYNHREYGVLRLHLREDHFPARSITADENPWIKHFDEAPEFKTHGSSSNKSPFPSTLLCIPVQYSYKNAIAIAPHQ